MTDPHGQPADAPPARESLRMIPPDQLRVFSRAPVGPLPPGLLESVRTYGVLQPLIVRPVEEGFEVLAGFKRLQAAREAGAPHVPVRVYNVEDAAIEGLQKACNLFAPPRRTASPSPSPSAFQPGGRLGGLLEEELNRPPPERPYKQVILAATVVLLFAWGVLALGQHWWQKRGSPPPPRADAAPTSPTPAPTAPEPTPAPGQTPVSEWRRLLGGIEGLEVRSIAGAPRLVFQEPVFSRLTTIDTAQETRLLRIVETVLAHAPNARLQIIGHTDNDPVRPGSSYGSNDQLGQMRADAVRDFLAQRTSLSPERLLSLSLGANAPPFPNDTPDGKTRNRTVTLEILQPRTP